MGESSKKQHNEQLKSYVDDPDVKSLATSIRKRAEDVNNIPRDSHSYTQYVVQQYFDNKMETEYGMKILEKLKNLKASDDIHAQSAESLLQKIKSLLTQFEKLCKNLEQEIVKIDEEKNRVGFVGFDFLPDLADIVSGCADIASDVADTASTAADVASNTADAASHPHIDAVEAASLNSIGNHEDASKYAVKAGFTAVTAIPLHFGINLVMSHFENKEKDLDTQKKGIDLIRKESIGGAKTGHPVSS
ncbi:hypothetical protein M0R45_008057 [Rubus argutus]|uniref:Uncharacterized protein n=1 Tax=Rubus argutus TaxID=59490 RepID=A0AAW1Y3C4_RUBAR